MGDVYDAPNQQVVRPDGSGPWEEGQGGSQHPPSKGREKDAAKDEPKQEKGKKG